MDKGLVSKQDDIGDQFPRLDTVAKQTMTYVQNILGKEMTPCTF